MQMKTLPPYVSGVREGNFVVDCAASVIGLACAILGFDCREVGVRDCWVCTIFLFGMKISSTPVTVSRPMMEELL